MLWPAYILEGVISPFIFLAKKHSCIVGVSKSSETMIKFVMYIFVINIHDEGC